MRTISTLFLLTVLSIATAYAQNPPVAVSEYFSTSDLSGIGEWTEVIVLDDDVDLSNYTLIDNNSSQTGAQGGVRFRPVAFWQHMRRGTIIVVRHRNETSITEDTDAWDGYLEIKATNAMYFDQIQLDNMSLPWTSVALNIASGGDILELRDPSDVHLHSLSHRLVTGSYYNSMSIPKPNYGGSLNDNNSVAISPGNDLASYSDNNAATLQTSSTKGLPNSTQNSTLWRALREPAQFSNTGLTVTPNANFTSINLSWTAIADAYTSDIVTGYIVLRSLDNTFTPPVDGIAYNVGTMLGTATVVENVLGSDITSFSDNVAALGIPCNQRVYYRLYPFRYGPDNNNNTSAARGRAYNTANFASGSVEKAFIGQATVTITGPASFCEGGSAQLKATPAGASYQWYRGGNPIAGATGDTYNATTSGGYTVQITASNGCSSTSITVATITVNPVPTTTMAPVQPQCLRNNSFNFSQTGVAGATYLWEFGSGAIPATSTDEDPFSISYSTPGSKTVRLTVTKDGCTFTATQTVQVNPSPSLSLSPVTPICEGDSIRLGAVAAAGVTYRWEGNGLSSYTTADPWAKPEQTTLYRLTITDPVSGCTAQQEITVTVLARPNVRIESNGPVTVCTGGTITLSDDGTSGGGQFTWLPNYQNGPVLTVTHDKPGVYIYRVVLTSGNGCRDTSNAIAISVLPKPDAFISTPQGTVVCRGQKVRLSANTVPDASYKWSNGADTKEIEVGPGTYRVSVLLGDGCESISMPVTVTELAPSFSVSTRTVKFADLGKCESNTETTVVITNTGKEDLSFTATASPHFVAAGGFTIPRNGSGSITLRFAPTDGAGTYKGRVYLTASPCGIIDSIDVEGTKVGTSDAKIDLSSIAYPTRLFCATEPQDTLVTFTNVGTEELRITSVGITPPFVLVSHVPSDFPLVLPPGTFKQFTFRFAPVAVGSVQRDAVLRYETGDCRDSLLVSLSGIYEQPSLTGDRSSLRFDPLPGCEEHRDSIVVVTNTGSATMTLDVSFDPPGEFSVQKHSSQLLAPGESDTILVRFRPSGSGVRQTTMQVRELLCNTVQEIALEGVKRGISFAVTQDILFNPLVAPCATGSTTAVLTIGNTSEEQAAGSVVSAALKNGSSEFQVSIPSGTALPNGETQSFTVVFAPTSDGVFADTLLLHLEPCDIIKMIPLSGVRGRVQLDKTGTEVVLAPQQVGNAINASLIFRNSGTVPVSVTSIDGITAPFSLLEVAPSLPATVLPDSIITITVKYIANDSKPDTVNVHAVYSTATCVLTSDSTMVIGQGIAPSVNPLPIEVTASLPVLTGSPGDEIVFPLVLNSDGLDTARITGVRAYISFDGTMLLPLSAVAGPVAPGFSTAIDEPQPGHLQVELGSETTMITGSGTAAGLHFRVLLGGSTTTPITIDSIEFDGPVTVTSTKSGGMFILTDSCVIQTRLLNVSGATGLAIVSSDAGSSVVEFSTAYDGPVALTLYDALGRQTSLPLSGEMRAGVYRMAIPTTSLPDGMYFLVLQASGITKTTGMPVVR